MGHAPIPERDEGSTVEAGTVVETRFLASGDWPIAATGRTCGLATGFITGGRSVEVVDLKGAVGSLVPFAPGATTGGVQGAGAA